MKYANNEKVIEVKDINDKIIIYFGFNLSNLIMQLKLQGSIF